MMKYEGWKIKFREFDFFLKSGAIIAILPVVFLIVSFSGAFDDLAPASSSNESFTADTLIFYRFLSALFILSLIVVFLFRNKIEQLFKWLINDFDRVKALQADGFTLYDKSGLNIILILIAVMIGLIAILLSFADVGAYWRFIDEDGLVEYGSFSMWALAAFLTLITLFLKRSEKGINKYMYIPLIMFFVVCGGEEISWGQRLIGSEESEMLIINKQHEINLHNIGSISFYSNLFFLLTLAFFVLLPLLSRRYGSLHKYLSHYGLPIPAPSMTRIYLTGLVVWIIIGVRFGTLGFHNFSLWGYYTQMDDEIFELYAAYSFFSFALLDLAGLLKTKAAGALKPANSRSGIKTCANSKVAHRI